MFQEGALRLKEAIGLPLQDSHPPGLALPTRFPDFTTGAGAESCTPHVLLALGVLGQDGCQSQMPMTAALLHIWKGNWMEAESDQDVWYFDSGDFGKQHTDKSHITKAEAASGGERVIPRVNTAWAMFIRLILNCFPFPR
ncbi:hypothetical protein MG293_012007 [Ovis ammon polii]|uniref:Uncharacterized protein n=1 Tax=Ovis ammon polii TaxID=230172 RepID=A0AAD4U605_OVIAM|nr:hypothetical protein MG293_012007 [Ovis ammon polii]